MTQSAKIQAANRPGVILYGLDEKEKPRAARFGPDHASLALKAAHLMGLTVCDLDTSDLAEIAQKLPAGRLYANGRGFVPNVRPALYAKLVDAVTKHKPAPETKRPDPAPPQPAPTPALKPVPTLGQAYPRDWSEITVGHLVLARDHEAGGWWEAIVVGIAGDMITLRWRDYPSHPKSIQHRSAVALLKPGRP
jgi:hypothetical protein